MKSILVISRYVKFSQLRGIENSFSSREESEYHSRIYFDDEDILVILEEKFIFLSQYKKILSKIEYRVNVK